MKKNYLLLLLSTLFVLTACKKEEPMGTVTLDPATVTVKYGDNVQLKPQFSEEGQAKDKSYAWKSSADSIVSVKASTDGEGNGDLTINRIGKATILFVSTDGLVSASAEVTVNPRSTILNANFYKKDASKNDVKNQIHPSNQLMNEDDNFLVYQGTSPIANLIYEFKSAKLESLWIVLEKNETTTTSLEQYIQERYFDTGKLHQGISYSLNTGVDGYPVGTAFGVFSNKEIAGVTYPYGVRVVDYKVIP